LVRWEAAFTWLSGILLLGLVYYKGKLLVDTDVRELSHLQAIAIGVWNPDGRMDVYDLLAQTPLVKSHLHSRPFVIAACVREYSACAYIALRWFISHVGMMNHQRRCVRSNTPTSQQITNGRECKL